MNGEIKGDIFYDFITGLSYRISHIVKMEKHIIVYQLLDNQKLEYNGKTNKYSIS